MTCIPPLEFWDLGHKLFRTTPDTFPVTFVPGNVFDPEHLSIVSLFTANSPPVTTVPDLRTLTSLNPLRGHVSAIYASSFFHLFPKDAQLRVARALAGLLSPKPGSMILGKQVGLSENEHCEEHCEVSETPESTFHQRCHTSQSWLELWDGEVFPKGTVRALAFVTEVPEDMVSKMFPEVKSLHMLTWSVTRL